MQFSRSFLFILASTAICSPTPVPQDGSLLDKGIDLIKGLGGMSTSSEPSNPNTRSKSPPAGETPPKVASSSSGSGSSLSSEQGKEAIGVAGRAIGGKIGQYIGPKIGNLDWIAIGHGSLTQYFF